MGRVLNLFGNREPEPEPEPEPKEQEFDFEDALFHIEGYLNDIEHATSPSEVKRLIKELSEEVKGWPDA